MQLANTVAATFNSRIEQAAQRLTALSFAAAVTLSMLGGIDTLASVPTDQLIEMAQAASAASRG